MHDEKLKQMNVSLFRLCVMTALGSMKEKAIEIFAEFGFYPAAKAAENIPGVDFTANIEGESDWSLDEYAKKAKEVFSRYEDVAVCSFCILGVVYALDRDYMGIIHTNDGYGDVMKFRIEEPK